MFLACSQRCGGKLFRALFAEVELDESGAYQDHRIAQPGYVCLNCGSPALDLSEVRAQMDADEEEDNESATQVADVLCPVCETMVALDQNMECPNCGSPLEVG
ncbi:MAG TPA: hypothetical protein VJT78_11425 [Candidatus Dormibacteraeota bacterium]|nr:hypothetical protein [Candidatus Dormibacteraeota bacterium]